MNVGMNNTPNIWVFLRKIELHSSNHNRQVVFHLLSWKNNANVFVRGKQAILCYRDFYYGKCLNTRVNHVCQIKIIQFGIWWTTEMKMPSPLWVFVQSKFMQFRQTCHLMMFHRHLHLGLSASSDAIFIIAYFLYFMLILPYWHS